VNILFWEISMSRAVLLFFSLLIGLLPDGFCAAFIHIVKGKENLSILRSEEQYKKAGGFSAAD